MTDICDCCRQRVNVVKDPEVLGVTGFKPNVFVCLPCIAWMKHQQEKRK